MFTAIGIPGSTSSDVHVVGCVSETLIQPAANGHTPFALALSNKEKNLAESIFGIVVVAVCSDLFLVPLVLSGNVQLGFEAECPEMSCLFTNQQSYSSYKRGSN